MAGAPHLKQLATGRASHGTRSSLPSIEVNKDGSGDFTTMQGAIDSLPGSNSVLTVLRIAPGEYYEKLTIDAPNIILCGQVGQVPDCTEVDHP